MDCKLVPYGEEERRCVKCGYITWNNKKTDKEIIDDMIAMGYPEPDCRISKQETLEEVAENFIKNSDDFKVEGFSEYQNGVFNGFIEGYKLAQQQMYSEEDLKKAFQDGQDNMDYSEMYGWSSKLTEEEWFKKHKKK